MNALPAAEREEVHWLVELVPDNDLPTLRRIVSALAVEPPCVSIDDAPDDDEPITQEDIEAEAEADRAIAEGRVFPHADVMRELGLVPQEDEVEA